MIKDKGKAPYIIALASGKGGVGKSFLAVNIAVHLSGLGKNVILMDADLGGANLHSLLGMNFAQYQPRFHSLEKINDLNQFLMDSGLKNLRLLSLAKERANIASLSYIEMLKIKKGLESLTADFLVIDTPCGTSLNSLDLFLLSPHGLLITTADPLSIENLFNYIKRLILRKIKKSDGIPKAEELIKEWMALPASSNNNLIDVYIQTAPSSKRKVVEEGIKTALADFEPNMVINIANTPEDRELGFSIQRMVAHYFGIYVEYLGYIEEDKLVKESILERKPLLLAYPESKPAKCIENITNHYLSNYVEQNEE